MLMSYITNENHLLIKVSQVIIEATRNVSFSDWDKSIRNKAWLDCEKYLHFKVGGGVNGLLNLQKI